VGNELRALMHGATAEQLAAPVSVGRRRLHERHQ